MRVQAPLKMSMIILSDYIGIKSDNNLIYIMYTCKLYPQIYNTYIFLIHFTCRCCYSMCITILVFEVITVFTVFRLLTDFVCLYASLSELFMV